MKINIRASLKVGAVNSDVFLDLDDAPEKITIRVERDDNQNLIITLDPPVAVPLICSCFIHGSCPVHTPSTSYPDTVRGT